MATAESDWLRVSHIDLPDGRLAYRWAGSGPPVLLLHGWAGSSRHWLFAPPALGEHFTLIAPDLPGFGNSPAPTGSADLTTLTRATLGLVDALGLPYFAVVGHSLGSAVALLAAVARPQQVARMALISFGVARSPDELALYAQVGSQIGTAAALWAPWLTLWRPWLAATRPWRELALTTPPMPSLLASSVVYQVDGLPSEALALGMADLAAMDARAAMETAASIGSPLVNALSSQVRAPTLVLTGKEDKVVPASSAAALAAALPVAHLHVLDDCGHVPMAECPADLYKMLGLFLSA